MTKNQANKQANTTKQKALLNLDKLFLATWYCTEKEKQFFFFSLSKSATFLYKASLK